MKAIKYLISIFILAGLVACQQEVNPLPEGDYPEGETVEVTFPVTFPEPIIVNTKASMGESPTADAFDVYLCLYGPGGYVQNWIPAELVSPTGSGVVTGGTYKVMLPLTNEKRTIHVIANPPEAANPVTSYYIDVVMEKMVNQLGSDDECSYWQEVVLENGIKAIRNDATGAWEVIPEYVKPLTDGVSLVRNFAKIIVTNPDDVGFNVQSWTLINVPTKGYVAPYTGDPDNRYPEGYLNDFLKTNPTPSAHYTKLIEEDAYAGYLPPVEEGEKIINTDFPGDPDTAPAGVYVGKGDPLYMYERPVPTSAEKQTAILVEIKFDDDHALEGATYWYKIEVLDDNGDYIPFLRDVVYKLNLQGLEEAGEATALDAYNGPYFGNISASLETVGINDLSNGKSLIHVDRLDFTSMTGDLEHEPLLNEDGSALRFWFVPDVTDPDATYVDDEEGICDLTFEFETVDGFDPAVTGIYPNDLGDGTMSVDLSSVGSGIKKSIIRISGKALPNGQTIYREITVNLMSKQNFVHVEGDVSTPTAIVERPDNLSGAEKSVKIKIQLPSNLGSSVFPIQVRIEAEANSLTTTSTDLPVVLGPSVFNSGSSASPVYKNTYYFVKTIKYSDYCKLDPRTKKYNYTYDFDCQFYTSKSGSNATTIDIRDLAGYFNSMTLEL